MDKLNKNLETGIIESQTLCYGLEKWAVKNSECKFLKKYDLIECGELSNDFKCFYDSNNLNLTKVILRYSIDKFNKNRNN